MVASLIELNEESRLIQEIQDLRGKVSEGYPEKPLLDQIQKLLKRVHVLRGEVRQWNLMFPDDTIEL